MRPFVTPKEMARLDQETMKAHAIKSFQLMDRVTDEMSEFFSEDLVFLRVPISIMSMEKIIMIKRTFSSII